MKFSLLSNEEISLFRQRLFWVGGAFFVLVVVLVLRLWFMQVINGGYYEEVAKGNRIRVVPQEAPRGVIYDRNGEILAYNRPSYNVQLVREDSPDLETTLANLAKVTQKPLKEIKEEMAKAKRVPRFKPQLIMSDINPLTADLLDTYAEDLPGIYVEVSPKRLYPNAFLTSHVVGYVGDISMKQLKEMPTSKLSSAKVVGQAGLELSQNSLLIGTDGGRQVEVDHLGRELRVIDKPVKPVPGANITLTVDVRLQRYLKNLLGGREGVVVMMRPYTGEILGMTSSPDYDPNLFVEGMDEKAWRELTRGKNKPLFNNAIHGTYPPASTFKMLVAMAALDLKLIEPDTHLTCDGSYRVGRDVRFCWNRSGHGSINVEQALQYSCNVFFYQLGLMVGVDRINEYGRMFGLAQKTGVELPGEQSGFLPTKEWKRRRFNQQWFMGETLPVAIGQGYINITPIQLLNYVNVLANDGVWVQPTILRKVEDPSGEKLVTDETLPRSWRALPFSKKSLDTIRAGMVAAVNHPGGTATRASSSMVLVAGKTGTSQVVGRGLRDADNLKTLPHSFFVAYAPANNPQVSIMVLVEHGIAGSEIAAPMARRALEYYFSSIEPSAPVISRVGPVEAAPAAGAFQGRDEAERARQFREKLQNGFKTALP